MKTIEEERFIKGFWNLRVRVGLQVCFFVRILLWVKVAIWARHYPIRIRPEFSGLDPSSIGFAAEGMNISELFNWIKFWIPNVINQVTRLKWSVFIFSRDHDMCPATEDTPSGE